ncbi:MAG: ATP-binding protein [Myxococcota bacterium]
MVEANTPRLGMARLLAFAGRLQGATDFDALLRITADEIRETLGYRNAWLAVFETEALAEARILAVSGPQKGAVWEHAPIIPVAGDQMMQELIAGDRPILVEDALTDPRVNREIVSALGNRTIINIPMRLIDKPFGSLGTGTFGEEGVRVPSEAELEHLTALAGHVALAGARIRLTEERARVAAQQRELERKMAQRQKLEGIGLLAGGVAHDFNNLLMIILTTAAFLEQAPLDVEQRGYLDMLEDAAEKARELTSQLLALGRRQQLRLQPVDVDARLRAVVGFLRRVIPASVEVLLREGTGSVRVEADETQLDQVVLNLGLNARDAMPRGGQLSLHSEVVSLNGEYVRAHPWAKAGRYVLLTVSDTGEGMPPEVQERIFEPFFTTKGPGQGSGLGLAVVDGIVRQHGGMIHCYSEPGVGTTFKVYWPVLENVATAAPPPLEGPVKGGSEKILLADDHRSLRRIVTDVLSRAGYQVTAVEHGAAAVLAAEREPFDLVILDAVMPVMGGPQAYERIRALQPRARFLFASGHAPDALPAEFRTGRGIRFLPKPVDPDGLLRAVRATIDEG